MLVDPSLQANPGLALHPKQKLELVAPVTNEYVPPGQRVHAEDPLDEKDPGGHARQEELEGDPCPGLYRPAGQGVGSMESRGQKKPAVHGSGAPEEQ